MNKLFILALTLSLAIGVGYSYAAYPASDNVILETGTSGPDGLTPATVIVKVRYGLGKAGKTDPGISSGDVLTWDIVSGDGFTVSKCIVDGARGYAGVAVTDIQTADGIYSRVNVQDRNWGWMAIRGYCLAKVDTSDAVAGHIITPNGATLEASFCTKNEGDTTVTSPDCGVLLKNTASDGLMPVWLR